VGLREVVRDHLVGGRKGSVGPTVCLEEMVVPRSVEAEKRDWGESQKCGFDSVSKNSRFHRKMVA